MTSDKLKLRPCPFCGCADIELLEVAVAFEEIQYWAQCFDCRASIRKLIKSNAINMWNTRTQEVTDGKLLE